MLIPKNFQTFKDCHGDYWLTDGKWVACDWNKDDNAYSGKVLIMYKVRGFGRDFFNEYELNDTGMKQDSLTSEEALEIRNAYNRQWGFDAETIEWV